MENSLCKNDIYGDLRNRYFCIRNIALLAICVHFGYFYILFFEVILRRFLLCSLSKDIVFALSFLTNSLCKSDLFAVRGAKIYIKNGRKTIMFFEILENGSFLARSGMALKRCTCVDFNSAGGGAF